MRDMRNPAIEAVESLDRPGMMLVASATATNGLFEMVEDHRDRDHGPPPHIHREHDEAFYVLHGTFTFTRGFDEIELSAGSFVFVAKGTRHAYRSHLDGGRLLFIGIPTGLAAFLRAQGQLLKTGVPVRDAMAALSATYDAHPVD